MNIKFKLQREGGGWAGELHLPDGLVAKGTGPSKAVAMRRASALATAALSNPLLRAALPPQAALALKAAGILARNPHARAAFKAFKSKGARRLARALF